VAIIIIVFLGSIPFYCRVVKVIHKTDLYVPYRPVNDLILDLTIQISTFWEKKIHPPFGFGKIYKNVHVGSVSSAEMLKPMLTNWGFKISVSNPYSK